MRFAVNALLKIALPLAALLLAVLPPTAPASAQDAIVIAVAGPMSGDWARHGEEMRQGADRAVGEINGQGGLLGRQVKLLVVDDACDAKRAASAAGEAADGGAVLVVGHFCSAASIAASAVYHDRGILEITPASSDPQVTDGAADAGWANIFRLCGRADREAEFTGAWIAANAQGAATAVVSDGTPLADLVASALKTGMSRGGMKPALEDAIAPGLPDYAALMIALKEKNIGVLYFAGQPPEAAVMAKQIPARHLPVHLVGSDALNNDAFLGAAEFAAEGVLFSGTSDAAHFAGARNLVAALQAQGVAPTDYTIRSYAAVRLWADAVAKAGATDAGKVAAALRSGSWPGVLGDVAFDAKGDPTQAGYSMYIVQGGRIGELKQ
jgi:branched-chain amino acid transport system substrate-binding protein